MLLYSAGLSCIVPQHRSRHSKSRLFNEPNKSVRKFNTGNKTGSATVGETALFTGHI